MTGNDYFPPSKGYFHLDGRRIEKPSSYYVNLKSQYLVSWFLSSMVKSGLNGPERIPLPDYPARDFWITKAFDLLFHYLLQDTKK